MDAIAEVARALLLRSGQTLSDIAMLYYAVVFFVVAAVAAVLGFGGIAGGAVAIAKILFFVFLVLFIGSLIWGLVNRNL